MSVSSEDVWVVTYTFNDHDGDRDQFVGVSKSFSGGRLIAQKAIKTHMGKNWPDGMLQLNESRSPGHLRLTWGDYWWDVNRVKVDAP